MAGKRRQFTPEFKLQTVRLAEGADSRREAASTHDLFSLYRSSLPAADRVIDLYRWRTRNPRASGGIRTVVARAEGAVVGAVNVVPVPLTYAGRAFDASWQQDTLVHPGWRGQGVGKKLVEAGAAGWSLSLGKGTVEPMYQLKQGIGFADAPNDNYLLRVLGPRSAGGSTARRIAFPALYAACKLRGQDYVRTGLRVRPISNFDARFDEQLAAADELAPRKDAAYLNWRYGSCPLRSYRVIAVEDGTRLRGAVVLRQSAVPHGDAWIVDMICDTGDDAAMNELLNAAFRELKADGAGCVRTFASSDRARRRLFRRGFINTRETPHFTFRANPEPREIDLRNVGWNFWHGDGDTELYH